MKTFKQFQEAALAIPAAAGVISKVLPAAAATIGGIGTIMQARKKRKIGSMEKRLYDRQKTNTDQSDDLIKSKPGEVEKQNKLIDRYSKRHKTPKQKTDTQKFLRDLARGEIIQDEFSVPTNNASSGNIAGLPPDSPPVKKKKPPMLKRKNYAKGGRNSRKPWLDYLKNK